MTAVELLFQQLWDTPKDKLTWYAIREEALKMEKQKKGYTEEQINDAVENVFYEMLNGEIDLEQFQQKIIKSLKQPKKIKNHV